MNNLISKALIIFCLFKNVTRAFNLLRSARSCIDAPFLKKFHVFMQLSSVYVI